MVDYKYQEQAQQEFGSSKLDNATGTIAGVIFAIVTVVLFVGLDDFENEALGIVFCLWVIICGAVGYFIGGNAQSEHFDKLRRRAEQLANLDEK